MATSKQTPKQLAAENKELRRRLDEAEETLRAIRDGQVDALVIDRPEGQQIYTLKGADRPYRHFLEEMQEGAVTLSQEGTIFYCNRRFAEMLKSTVEGVMGRNCFTAVASGCRELLLSLM